MLGEHAICKIIRLTACKWSRWVILVMPVILIMLVLLVTLVMLVILVVVVLGRGSSKLARGRNVMRPTGLVFGSQ